MKNAPYWTAVVVGLVAILVIFFIVKRKQKADVENFVDSTDVARLALLAGSSPTVRNLVSTGIQNVVNATSGSTVGTTSSPAPSTLTQATYYEGTKSTIPSMDKLYIYLSSFSGIQSDGSTSVFSGAGVPVWRSLVNEDVVFNVIGTDLPATIENGLPMKGTRLVGPPSENAAYPNTNYVLPSFTIAWYAKWKSLDFDTEAPIILFRMFAENPNHVQVSVREVDSNTVSLDAVVGNASSVYSWNIPKTTLLTQGTGTLYAFVYNREEKKISFNIGSTIKYPRVLTDPVVVKLGNTPMDINYNQNWDADLKAFMFYRDALLDFNSMDNYMIEQASGKNLLLSTVTTQQAALAEQLKSCSLTDGELAGLRDELNLTREQLYNIRLKLRQCTQKPENIDPHAFRRWQIKNGLYPGDYSKLNQCKDLNVRNFDEIKQNLAGALINLFARPSAPQTQTTKSSTFPPTLYTEFPNDGFKKQTTDPNTAFIPSPYPDGIAKPPTGSSSGSTTTKSSEPWRLKEMITNFGQKEPIQQSASIANAQIVQNHSSLPAHTHPEIAVLLAKYSASASGTGTAPSSTTTSSMSGVPGKMETEIPEATLLPRPEVSNSGVPLVYGDYSSEDSVYEAKYTNTIANPAAPDNMNESTINQETTSTSDLSQMQAGPAQETGSAPDDTSLLDKLISLFK